MGFSVPNLVHEATIFCTGAAAKGNNIPLRRRQHDNIYCSVSNSSIHSDLPPPALSEDYPDSSPLPLVINTALIIFFHSPSPLRAKRDAMISVVLL